MTYDNGTNPSPDRTFNANPDFQRNQNMQDRKPMRPGFSNGTEELRWRGKPALRSMVYIWSISIVATIFISHYWLMLAMILAGKGVPYLVNSSGTGPSALAYLLPWIICLWPAFSRTISLWATTYELTSQRLIVRSGILLRTHDQVELFRVRDFLVDAPLYLTVLGLGHIRVISRDETLPLMTLFAQPEAPALIDVVRGEVLRRKDEVGVREIEAGTMG